MRPLIATAAAAALATLSVHAPAATASQGAPAGGGVATEEVVQAGSPVVTEDPPENGVYIVQMADQPVTAYTGGVKGLKATKPAKGKKINPNSPAVVAYADYLTAKHDAAVKTVGGTKMQSYVYVYNGFAAKLSPKQAAAMVKVNGVLAVSGDEKRTLDTSSTPEFLGLTDPDGLWNQLGDPSAANKKTSGAGENVIIGIVDGGIWPEHPSVSDRDSSGRLLYQQVPGWNGRCVPGEEFNAALCNQKLIGARFYNAGWGGNAGIDAQLPWEFNSPRDYGGHGTHTATTAGGNYGVAVSGPAVLLGSTVSGMAPRARIAAYKVCWETGAGGSCFSSDSVAAIDQAVADGVDVINFSISGSRTSFLDPVEVAFLFAADAGVFVAASAGNEGPAESTVAHPGPWLTTVAAGTHNRAVSGSVTLGDGLEYFGASVAPEPVTAPIIDSVNAGLADADLDDVEWCVPGTLDPVKVEGKIVLCLRGEIARVDKSLAVQEAGGVGMVLYNDPDSSLNADFHFVPTVHVNKADGLAIMAYAEIAGATATINKADVDDEAAAPYTADFSSRGPLLAASGDLLKPDVIAPGQDILAGVAPPGNAGRLFDLYSGTSMSSPHVAGLAALLKQAQPSWSPMAIKSALMTSAYDVLDEDLATDARIFSQGAGHVEPNSAVDPGLVFDAGWNDWLAFLCGTGQLTASYCPDIAIDPSDYNSASISIGSLAGTQPVTRKVTNVGSSAATYTATVTGMSGINVEVSPSTFTLAAGETKSVTVTFTTTTASLNAYAGGQLTWSDGTHSVRIPMVVRPVALAAPTEVTGTGDPISYDVRFGYAGPFSATARGLVAADPTAGTVADDPTDGTCSLTSPNAYLVKVAVTAATTYARFSLFDADVNPGSDLDLCVFRGTTLVGSSGSGTSAEEVNLLNPAADLYTVVVQGWGVAGSTPFKLHTWLLGSNDADTMTVSAPTSATLGVSGKINLTFNGLAAGAKYLGSVAYGGAAGMPNPTIVRVDVPTS